MASASGCGIASDLFHIGAVEEDLSIMDGESLRIAGTASTQMDYMFPLAGDPYPEPCVTRSFDPCGAVHELSIIPCYDALPMGPSAWTGQEAALNIGCKNTWPEISSHDAPGIMDDAWATWPDRDIATNLDCDYTLLESFTVQSFRRFQATDVPPGVPSNSCFRFAPTTYWLRGVHAHDLANMMLDFRTAKVVMTITKVSHTKFSIKADICIDGSNCVAKMRVYSNNANRALALELQRRSGCSLVFNRFYQQAGDYLVARQKSLQLELLNALEGGSSTVWTNDDVGIDGVAGKYDVAQAAWAHEPGLSRGDLFLDAE